MSLSNNSNTESLPTHTLTTSTMSTQSAELIPPHEATANCSVIYSDSQPMTTSAPSLPANNISSYATYTSTTPRQTMYRSPLPRFSSSYMAPSPVVFYTPQIRHRISTSAENPLPQQLNSTSVLDLPIDEKINFLIIQSSKSSETIEGLHQDITVVKNDIKSCLDNTHQLQDDNAAIKQQLYQTQGKLSQLQTRYNSLEQRTIESEYKQYSKNLMFYNVPDSQNESPFNLKNLLYQILFDLNVYQEHIFSSQNPAGEIRIDTANRLGKYSQHKSRPVLATFVTKAGRDMILTRQITTQLREHANRIKVSEQYPPEIREKRFTQVSVLKDLKQKNPDDKITIVKDKLLINNKPSELSSTLFELNPLPDISPISAHFKDLYHTKQHSEKQSTFQAHRSPVYSLAEATAARSALYQHPSLAKAKHILYAYRFTEKDGRTVQGFSDDGEISGGRIILDQLISTDTNNTFLAVSRMKQGGNIGKARFELISKCAKESIRSIAHYEDKTMPFLFLY